jgi:hypothetical protein
MLKTQLRLSELPPIFMGVARRVPLFLFSNSLGGPFSSGLIWRRDSARASRCIAMVGILPMNTSEFEGLAFPQSIA